MAKADPKNAQVQNDLSVSYERLGDVAGQLGRLKESLEYCQKALEVRLRLAEADPKNAEVQRNLSISYNKFGAVSLQSNQTKESLEYYQKALPIRNRLAEADPKNTQAQRDLGFSFEKLGDANLRLDNTKESLEFYQRAEAIFERLAAADPKNVNAQRDVSACCYNLACGFARLSVGADKAAQAKAAQQAMDFLRQAVAEGFKDLARLKVDKDVDSLRGREDFKKLVAELEQARDSK